MIKKLRFKFILTNMALVSLVLVIVFGVLVGSTSQRLSAQSVSAMRLALEWSELDDPPRFEFGPPPADLEEDAYRQEARRNRGEDRQFMMIPVFCAALNEDSSVAALHFRDSVEVSDEVLEQAVAQALAKSSPSGVLPRLDLRYMVEVSADGVTHIAFADRSWERSNLNSLIGTSLLIGAGALLGFFLISLLLSKIATRPVEKAWEQQRQFVADASHELKTPLTVILANSGILLAHRDDTVARQAKWVEYIREEAQRMKGLVEDMLFLAKSDAARTAVSRIGVDMSETAESCLLPFESVAFEAGVSLACDIQPGLLVPGDEGQLRRLVLILLDNACKYAGEGGAVELLLCRAQEKVRLTVHNSGAPIPAEHLPHLFERFYRSDSARTREAGGYGLGLAIAKSIVDGHRGKITVASAPGAGTAFTVLLPSGK